MIKTPRQELKQLEEELKQQVPEPMHSMLEKESREDAIQKHNHASWKKLLLFPQHVQVNGLAPITQAYIYNYKQKK